MALALAAFTDPSAVKAQEVSATGSAADAVAAVADEAYETARTVSATAIAWRTRAKNPMTLSDRQLVVAAAAVAAQDPFSSATPEFTAWRRELEGGLKKKPLTKLSIALAGRHGIPAAAMEGLARDWLVARVGGSALAQEGDLAAIRPAFTARVLRDVAEAKYAPFALEIAAQSLYVASDCMDPALVALIEAAPDKALASWVMSRGTSCTSLGRGALASPERRTTILLRLLESGEIQDFDAIALEAWLLDGDGLARVDAADAPALRQWLTRRLIAHLLENGMEAEAIARFDALDAGGKAGLLQRTSPAFTAKVDGAGLEFDPDRQSARVSLAAAMALAGRKSDAAALLDGDAKLASSQRVTDCLYAKIAAPPSKTPDKDICGLGERDSSDAIGDAIAASYVREAVAPTGADLYPLVELVQAFDRSGDDAAVMVRLRCQLLTEPQYAELCRTARRRVADGLLPLAERKGYDIAKRKVNLAAIAAAGLPGWAELTARIEAWRTQAKTAFTDAEESKRYVAWSEREAVEPDASPFPEKPLPAQLRSPLKADRKALAWPRGWAHLPEEFEPVRTGQSGALAIVVSSSSRFDPGGEVSRGGYWVHLSRDGGKSWQAPLYTGLAAQFPYVVPESSRLPLLYEETIQLEVAVALLDTRSITYPSVGLRTRRTARDLYLEIPLAALAADSNGDGLTDLASHHLLLDQPAPLAPFVVGSDRASCATGPGALQQLRALFLKRLVGGRQEAALLEPIDRPADAGPAFGWAQALSAKTGPLFLKGAAADFSCMQLPFPAFVYGAAGEEALQRKTPDFRMLEAPPIIMNREGTRGYVVWSLGWTGGTMLFMHGPEGWRMEEISNWIT